jgi:hypothetical protein
MLSKNVNTKIKIEDLRPSGKNSLCFWREIEKKKIAQVRTLLKVSCASRTCDVSKSRRGHPRYRGLVTEMRR